MWTTFDRYVFSRYAYVLAVFFFACMGLYTVVDSFSQSESFQNQNDSVISLAVKVVSYYFFQSSLILDLVGPSLSVIAVMVVLALLLKNNEFYPVLSAGVPTYRVAVPLLFGVLCVSIALVANQEFLIPTAVVQLQATSRSSVDKIKAFDPQYDSKSSIFVGGQHLSSTRQRIIDPIFVLPTPEIVAEYEPELKGEYAAYIPARGKHPAGWLLKNVSPAFDLKKLTPAGRKIVKQTKNPNDLFLCIGLTFDQLRNRGTGFRYLSTSDLIHRIQHPNAHASSTRAQIMHLHSRFTRPIISLMSVFLVVPLIIRKERDNLITNISMCTLALAMVLGIAQGMEFLGQTSLLKPEVAAWGPILFGGTLAGWLSGSVKT
ncbi:MAG: LptF/LptG family permease [Planctomycetota bacterium]|nr:MAG: LptF/LptG family permease [Planctomycetota bacterium]